MARSNLHPQRLFALVPSDATAHVADGPSFVRRLHSYRSGSGSARMNIALSALPKFACLHGISRRFGGRFKQWVELNRCLRYK